MSPSFIETLRKPLNSSEIETFSASSSSSSSSILSSSSSSPSSFLLTLATNLKNKSSILNFTTRTSPTILNTRENLSNQEDSFKLSTWNSETKQAFELPQYNPDHERENQIRGVGVNLSQSTSSTLGHSFTRLLKARSLEMRQLADSSNDQYEKISFISADNIRPTTLASTTSIITTTTTTTVDKISGATSLLSDSIFKQRSRVNYENTLHGTQLQTSPFYTTIANSIISTSTNDEQVQQQVQQQQQQQQEQQSSTSPISISISSPLMSVEQSASSFSDWWNEYWSRQPFPSGYTQSSITLLACFISVIIFLIVVGNLLVCIAIFTEKSLKSTQNWFIASLAVSDMLLGLVVMPFSLARELMGFWIFGPLWCDIHEAVDVLLTTASINTLCLISLDRYWSITQAVSYLKKRTPRRGAFMIAFVWIFSAAVSLPPLFGWKKQQTGITVTTKSETPPSTRFSNRQTSKPLTTTAMTTTTMTTATSSTDDNSFSRAARSTTTKERRFDATNNDYRDQLAIPILNSQQSNKIRASHSRSLYNHPIIGLKYKRGSEEGFQEQSDIDTMPINIASYDEPNSNETSLIGSSSSSSSSSSSGSSGSMMIYETTTEYPSCQLSDDIGYVLYSALGSFYIPCAVMVFTYIKIFLAARSRARRTITKSNRNKDYQNSGSSQRRHLTPGSLASHRMNPTTGPSSTGSASGRMLLDSPILSVQIDCKKANERRQFERSSSKVETPMVKGKIVIVERKKSMAASSLAPLGNGYETRSDFKIDKTGPHEDSFNCKAATKVTELDNLEQGSDIENATTGSCTITTSAAKLASPQFLNEGSCSIAEGKEENGNTTDLDSSSSIITVMRPSMDQVPVTRYDFQSGGKEHLEGQDRAKKENNDAAKLIKAFSQISNQKLDDTLLNDVISNGSGDKSPGEMLNSTKDSSTTTALVNVSTSGQKAEIGNDKIISLGCDQVGSTNETCFMTVEEDSDMIDTQAGRTIMMVAGNSYQKHQHKTHGGMMMTMMPASSEHQSGGSTCNNYACRRQLHAVNATRSGSSYCDSSMTINDVDIEADMEVCGDDDEDNDEDEDDILTDDDGECNEFSISCGLEDADYCSHCHECADEQDDQQDSSMASYTQSNRNQSSVCDSPCAKASRSHGHHHHHQSSTRAQVTHRCSNIEAHSFTRDDNASLAEYRSNDENESSSMIVQDSSRKKTVTGPKTVAQLSSNQNQSETRKKSIIGLRLGSLVGHSNKSSNTTTNQTGPSTTAILSSPLPSTSTPVPASGRNLKALRQNFFMKLNQLTAMSSSKTSETKGKKLRRPSLSVEHSTTNAQELMETTIVDDYDGATSEVQNSGTTRYSNDGDQSNQPYGNSSEQTNESDETNQQKIGETQKWRKSEKQQNIDQANNSQLKRVIGTKSTIISSSSGERSGQTYEDSVQTYNDKHNAQRSNRKIVTIDKPLANRSTTLASSSLAPASGSNTKRAHLPSDTERHKRKLAKARERRATLILGLIMAAFITSWLPFFTFYVTRALCVVCRDYVSPRFEAFIFWMGYCNSAINPIIYTIFNRDFRKAFRKILFRCL